MIGIPEATSPEPTVFPSDQTVDPSWQGQIKPVGTKLFHLAHLHGSGSAWRTGSEFCPQL